MSKAWWLLGGSLGWIACCGVVFSATQHVGVVTGLYWATATATTVGYGDVTPHTTAGQLLAIGAMLTMIPLLAATFALANIMHLLDRMREHVDNRLAEHHKAIHARLDRLEGKKAEP